MSNQNQNSRCQGSQVGLGERPVQETQFSILSSPRKTRTSNSLEGAESRLVLLVLLVLGLRARTMTHQPIATLKIVAAEKIFAVSRATKRPCQSRIPCWESSPRPSLYFIRRHASRRRSWAPLDDPRSFVWHLWVHLIGSMGVFAGTSPAS